MCAKQLGNTSLRSLLSVVVLAGGTAESRAQQVKLRFSREVKDFVFSVAFSHDAKFVAGAIGDGTVKVWNAATGRLELDHKAPIGQVRSLAFHPHRYLLASAGGDVRLWELPKGKLNKTLEGPDGPGGTESLAFSQDGKILAAAGFGQGGNRHAVFLWDVEKTEKVGGIGLSFGGGGVTVHSVAFQGDKRVLALGTHYHEIGLWDIEKKRMQATLKGHRDEVMAVASSQDGKLLASASEDRTVRLWDPVKRRVMAILKGHTGVIHAVAVSPDGRLVASGSHDKSIRLWNTTTGKLHRVLDGHKGWVFGVAFSKNGKLLASAGGGYGIPGEVKVWDLSDRHGPK